jgi:hypothetical protein
MSADNWRVCPVCGGPPKPEGSDPVGDAEKLYGKIPAHEFMERMRIAAKTISPLDDWSPESMREDYCIHSEGTVVIISYSCSCCECGFSAVFEQTIDMCTGLSRFIKRNINLEVKG